MMIYHLFLSFVPLMLIGLLNLSLFSVLSKTLKDKSLFLLLSVFLSSPLIIGLILYLLFFYLPNHSPSFYLLVIALLIFLVTFFERKNLGLVFQVVRERSKVLRSQSFDLFSKIILFAVLFILLLVFLRTIFWPINWVDQIYYVKQAYVFAQTRSLDMFFSWGFFHDSQLANYQMNPAIRPGLPMIFTTTFLLNNSLQDAQLFCQSIIFYYFFLTCCVVFYLSWKIAKNNPLKQALAALFLILSTFHFIYLSIEGFKELIIIPLTLLALFYISSQENKITKLNQWIYLGITTGLISFVNYSGVLITLFLLLVFVITKKISLNIILITGKILLFTIIFSGSEFFAFWNNLITPELPFNKVKPWSNSKDVSAKNISKDIINTTPNSSSSSETSKASIPDAQKNTEKKDFISSVPTVASREFIANNITSLKDLYLKGKFQGFFQVQYFGLIFVLFALVVVTTYKNLRKDRFIKTTLLFLLIYGLVMFDPFNINHTTYAYVLSINHKYTTLLVPFIALIIAYQLDSIEKLLKRIPPLAIITIMFIFEIFDFILFKNNPHRLFEIISAIIPIVNGQEYYIQKLNLLNDLALIINSALLTIIFYLYIKKRSYLISLIKDTSLITIMFLLTTFAFPFFFFYNSNFGLINTLAYSFSADVTQLEKIIGWENLYSPIKSLNELPKDKKIIFIDQSVALLDIHLKLPMENITSQSTSSEVASPALKSMDVSYIYAKNSSELNGKKISELSDLELLNQVGDNLLFKVKP